MFSPTSGFGACPCGLSYHPTTNTNMSSAYHLTTSRFRSQRLPRLRIPADRRHTCIQRTNRLRRGLDRPDARAHRLTAPLHVARSDRHFNHMPDIRRLQFIAPRRRAADARAARARTIAILPRVPVRRRIVGPRSIRSRQRLAFDGRARDRRRGGAGRGRDPFGELGPGHP